MNNPLDQIQSYYEDLTKTDKDIAVYIINNPDDVVTQSMDFLVEKTGSSKSALSRFAQRIGYSGYIEFKYEVFSRIKWAVSYEFKNERGEWVQDVLDNNGEGMTFDEAGDVVFHIMGDWQETRNERSIPFNKEAIA